MPTTPDLLFVDALLLAYRLGHVRYEEQKLSLLAAAREATDTMSFLTALEGVGIGRRTGLYAFVGNFLAAPVHYRAQYPQVLGLRRESEQAESFLNNPRVLSLVEGILIGKQQRVFYEAYWWFVHNHQPTFCDPRKGLCIGAYATDPKDNASALERFEDYLLHMMTHKSQRIRERFEGFPTDIIMAVLRRTFV